MTEPDAAAPTLHFEPVISFATGAGRIFLVAAHREMSRDRPEIVGQWVTVKWGGSTFAGRVAAVERRALRTPIKKGESIGIRLTTGYQIAD